MLFNFIMWNAILIFFI